MNAAVIVDGKLEWAHQDDPVAGDTQLLVAVEAAGLNGADILQRKGFYPAPPGWPQDIPGMELAGEVIACGSKTSRFQPGDKVMAIVGGGAHAELAVVDEATALPVPDGISWEEAGGFPEVFYTAFDALFTQCELSLGETVLVTGASGGVGTAAIQLASAAGAQVVASTRHRAHEENLISLGATLATDPDTAAGSGPFDVVLELVGNASLPSALSNLAIGARVSVIGVGSGSKVEIDLLKLMGRRARIHGSTLRARLPSEKASVTQAVEHHVLPLLSSGQVKVPIASTLPLEQANEAYDRFAAGSKLGKIVLVARS